MCRRCWREEGKMKEGDLGGYPVKVVYKLKPT